MMKAKRKLFTISLALTEKRMGGKKKPKGLQSKTMKARQKPALASSALPLTAPFSVTASASLSDIGRASNESLPLPHSAWTESSEVNSSAPYYSRASDTLLASLRREVELGPSMGQRLQDMISKSHARADSAGEAPPSPANAGKAKKGKRNASVADGPSALPPLKMDKRTASRRHLKQANVSDTAAAVDLLTS